MKKFLLALFVTTLLPLQASAAPLPVQQMAVCAKGAPNFFMIQPWYACLDTKNGQIVIDELSDLFKIIFPLVDSLVKIAAVVAVFIIFFMIFKMMTARGDTGKIASAGIGIRDSIIGLIIAISSIAIINFVAGAFVIP